MSVRENAGPLFLAAALLAAAGCGEGRAGNADAERDAEPGVAEYAPAASSGAPAVLELPVVTVYKSPTCGCCAAWVDHMRKAGFEVEVVDDAERLAEAKRRHAIGPGHTSCHTAEVGGYFVEGHVPAADVKRLLAEAPADLAGLAVPGMPMGSPGMEGPRKDAYEVIAIGESGAAEVFARH